MRCNEFILDGKTVNALSFIDDSIIEVYGRKWIVSNDSSVNSIELWFNSITDEEFEILKTKHILPELMPFENSVIVNYYDDVIFVDEYYNFGFRTEFNGYKEFESVDAAFKWCSEHTNEEIHVLLSQT